MSLGRLSTIARANLVRLLRDRLGLFFILVLPLIIVLVTGLQFGGGFEARIGFLAVDGGRLADELAATLTATGRSSATRAPMSWPRTSRSGASRSACRCRIATPSACWPASRSRSSTDPAPSELATARRSVVGAAVTEQAALARAAAFAAGETGRTTSELLPEAQALSASLPDVEVEVTTVGESLFPPELAGFALGAQGQLILFIFLTSLTGASQLILSRTLGVSRRMLSTPTPMPSILLGEALGRFGVALFQGLFIVGATAIAFGVVWGDPLGAAALVITFSLVSAGVAMLVGAISTNAEQATSIGVFAGLGVAALGGSMIPPEIFPPIMDTISWFTPHRWALDGFREIIAGGTVAAILPQLGVLLAFAVVLLALATWRLQGRADLLGSGITTSARRARRMAIDRSKRTTTRLSTPPGRGTPTSGGRSRSPGRSRPIPMPIAAFTTVITTNSVASDPQLTPRLRHPLADDGARPDDEQHGHRDLEQVAPRSRAASG